MYLSPNFHDGKDALQKVRSKGEGSVNQKNIENGNSFTGKWLTNFKIYRMSPARIKEQNNVTRL